MCYWAKFGDDYSTNNHLTKIHCIPISILLLCATLDLHFIIKWEQAIQNSLFQLCLVMHASDVWLMHRISAWTCLLLLKNTERCNMQIWSDDEKIVLIGFIIHIWLKQRHDAVFNVIHSNCLHSALLTSTHSCSMIMPGIYLIYWFMTMEIGNKAGLVMKI